MSLDTSKSGALFERALGSLPGGVSSPVRAFGAVDGTPIFFQSAAGAWFTDADGNRYLDFVQSWGPSILGHAHAEVVKAVQDAAANGLSFGASCAGEVDLAEQVKQCYPGIDKVRFTSSGTEATMSAIRLARGVTGRDRLLKFSGCYHGHSDGLLVAAGSGAATLGQPSSAGVPADVAKLTSVLPLADRAALDAFFEKSGAELAAVIIEPVPANNGLLVQTRDYLQHLRDLCTKHGALLIFDEVISGFRVALGGAAERYGIQPDLVTFGKVLGGGMPVGAFAGPAKFFEYLAPSGPVYQAGTLSGNPVAMAAGLATINVLRRDGVLARLEEMGQQLEERMCALLDGKDWPVVFVRLGSLFWFAFGARSGPVSAEQVSDDAPALYRQFHAACLAAGVYLAPSAYEVGFLSAAHTDADIEHVGTVFGDVLHSLFAAK
ncbi:MAG: glutamate-1-semialdehyde 2,1-aminomutase [Planctomycetota bacterium]|jgi:glutamate-1-semialdehyde 2,1-aminomutase